MRFEKIELRGVFTALITPFKEDGSVDVAGLDALIDGQLEAGIDGLVPCGTTGESATMSAQERQDVIARVVERVDGRVPVIAGTGANATAVAIEHQKRARDAGATCALVVTPYYNKPSAEGLFRHYKALLDAVELPIIAYNVPGRTGCDMKPETVGRIARLDGLVGIKEATADVDRVAAIRNVTRDDFLLLSGDDGTTCPFVLLGGDGVISVTSNVAPQQMVAMVHAALEGKLAEARGLHNRLRPLFRGLFLESNPIPVKTALALAQKIRPQMRLPLCEMSAGPKQELEAILREGGWLD